jgi:UDP-glucose 4-epimerase
MRILFTGASSFTGSWIVKRLSRAGHELVCPLRGAEVGEGLRGRRLDWIRSSCRLVEDAPFGSDRFMAVATGENFDLLCHHAAEVGDYKSPGFDVRAAVEKNTHNLPQILAELKARGLRGVIWTGTYFEPEEGRGTMPLSAFSPYGLSKGLSWQVLRQHCGEQGLPTGKFVIPNPFGPLEEPRFTGYLMNQWKTGQVALVRTPDYIRDNLPVDLMAAAYEVFASSFSSGARDSSKLNPSGYTGTQRDFSERVAREVRQRTGWNCGLEFQTQSTFTEPLERTNSEPALSLVPHWNEAAAWDRFVRYYCEDRSPD